MKSLNVLFLAAVLCSSLSYAGLTEIVYSFENISDGQWRYHYKVKNNGLADGIGQFTIWFDYAKYASIQIASDMDLDEAWDQLVWQPNEILKNNGGFDALALITPIDIGETISGFSVSFIWNGQDEPGRQFYEIVNPDNPSDVLNSGFTVLIPEPFVIGFMIIGMCFLKRRGQ